MSEGHYMRRKQFYRSSGATGDLSVSSIVLTLVLLGTIVAGNTDHPIFWLLIGPAPLGIGFTLITFLRQGLGRNHFSGGFEEAKR
jgi:hypothetical protein